MLQCVAVCASGEAGAVVLQGVVVCARQGSKCSRVLQCVTVCCSKLQCCALCAIRASRFTHVLQRVAVCCSVLQCVLEEEACAVALVLQDGVASCCSLHTSIGHL